MTEKRLRIDAIRLKEKVQKDIQDELEGLSDVEYVLKLNAMASTGRFARKIAGLKPAARRPRDGMRVAR